MQHPQQGAASPALCRDDGRRLQHDQRSASGLSAKTPCAVLENKENNQNVRAILELEWGTAHQVAVKEQVEQLQLLGDGFPPQPFKLRAGERGKAEVTSERNI